NRLEGKEFIYVTQAGDTLMIRKEDDLNTPSEFMITQKNATRLKEKLELFRSNLIAIPDENNTELIDNISASLDTSDPRINLREGGENESWETERFLDKPLVAVLTMLSKIQIDVK